MKRFLEGLVFFLMIGSLLSACATGAGDRRGSGGKKSMPTQAKEQVVDPGSSGQSQSPSK
jgi:hypothetical protein